MRRQTCDIAQDFPLLHPDAAGRRLVYLDNAATTQKPQPVIDRICAWYRQQNANVHRGNYPLALAADSALAAARATVQRWLHAASAEEIVFTRGCTEGLNRIAAAALDAWAAPGDNIVVTELEHSSNDLPFREQCRRRGVALRVAQAGQDGSLRPQDVLALTDSRTRLVAITAMSNVTGFRPELTCLIRQLHGQGIRVAVDAAQEAAHHRIDVQALGCDLLCFSAHKLYGPMGCGVLYGRREALEQLPPWQYGGGMLAPDGESWAPPPARWEAGTPNVEGAVGLAAALEYLEQQDLDALAAQEAALAAMLRQGLQALPGLHLLGPPQAAPVASFTVDWCGTYDLGVLLGRRGIAVRCGTHCAYPLMRRLGVENCCRVSLGIYNTRQDVEALLRALAEIREVCHVRG